jgi:DNA-binding SARP family transcriptional activator
LLTAPSPDPTPSLDPHEADTEEDTWQVPKPRLLVTVLGKPSIPARAQANRRDIAITVYLATIGLPVPAEELHEAIWNGKAVQRKTVYNAISHARATLGQFDDGEPLLPESNHGDGLSRLAPGVTTDLQLFTLLCQRAAEVPASESAQLLHQALALVYGRPFAGDGYEWAAAGQHASAAEIAIEQAADQLIEIALDTDQHDLGRHAVIQALKSQPANEHLYRQRMTIEHHAGNPAAVRSAYAELEFILREDGSTPAEQTTILRRRLAK